MVMKRLLTLVLISCLLLAMAACGGQATQPTTGTTAATTTQATTKAPVATEIVFWDMVWGPADTYPAAAEELVKQFNDTNDQGITVKYQSTPWDNFYQTFLTAVTSGAAPDVSTGAFPQPVQYAIMEEILDLTPVLDMWEAEGNAILQDYSPGALDLHRWDNKQVGLPWNSDPRQITYRKDYFEQAGITSDPKNWDEFMAACEKLKEKLPEDVYPLAFAAADQMMTQNMLFFMFQNDCGITNADGNASDFTNVKVGETLKFLNELYVKGYIPEGTVSYKGSDAEKLYLSGKAAMYLAGPMTLKDYPDIDSNSGILSPMAGPSGKAQNFTWLNAIMAYEQTDSPASCHVFIKWWLENQLPLWTKGLQGSFPARLSFLKDPFFQSNWVKREIGEKVMPTAVPPVYPATFLYPAFSQIEGENYPGKALQGAISSQTPDYDALTAEWNEKIADAMKEFAD